MTESVSTAQESTVTTEGSTANPIKAFVATMSDVLVECGVTEEMVASVEADGLRITQYVEQLESELESVRDQAGRDRAELSSRVTELEESQAGSENTDSTDGYSPSDSEGMTGQSGEDGITNSPQSPRTALGDCVTLPEPIQEAELTANVRRATEMASGAIDYCRSVPAGYAITSSELRTVLTALKDDDGRTYTETVSRVIEYLDELGGDCIEVTETMSGQRTVVFDDEFVRRTVAWRQSTGNDVVTEKEARG